MWCWQSWIRSCIRSWFWEWQKFQYSFKVVECEVIVMVGYSIGWCFRISVSYGVDTSGGIKFGLNDVSKMGCFDYCFYGLNYWKSCGIIFWEIAWIKWWIFTGFIWYFQRIWLSVYKKCLIGGSVSSIGIRLGRYFCGEVESGDDG